MVAAEWSVQKVANDETPSPCMVLQGEGRGGDGVIDADTPRALSQGSGMTTEVQILKPQRAQRSQRTQRKRLCSRNTRRPAGPWVPHAQFHLCRLCILCVQFRW